MEISQICSELIKVLCGGSNRSIKEFNEKTEKINALLNILKDFKMREEFIKSTYITDVIQSILTMSVSAVKGLKTKTFPIQRFECVPNFFTFLSSNRIPLAREENDTQELINVIKDIFSNYIPESDNDYWIFWLKIFTEIIKIPTFYNLFRNESDNSSSTISYLQLDSLFTLITDLMKCKRIMNDEENFYSQQRSLILTFFSTFLENSPFPPSQDIIHSIFELSDSLSSIDLSDEDFHNQLSIINKLISLSPLSLIVNENSSHHGPFNEKIIDSIFDRWSSIQMSQIQKSASSYLLLFLTASEYLQYPIKAAYYTNWSQRILSVWTSFKSKDKIFESNESITYLRADVDILKMSGDDTMSKTLIQFIIDKKARLNVNSNIIYLFTSIGKYSADMIHRSDWIQVLKIITNFDLSDVMWRNQEFFVDYLNFVSVLVDVIDPDENEWNNVFIFLIQNQPSNEPIPSFYLLLSKMLSLQKIDTKIVHCYQGLLWNAISNRKLFSNERLKCIHTLIYYYGFSSEESRANCFNSLISIFDSSEKFPVDYSKQLAFTIYSVISSYPCPIIENNPTKEEIETIDDICHNLKELLELKTNEMKKYSTKRKERIFSVTPDNSQNSLDEEIEYNENKSNQTYNKNNSNYKFRLCNYISKEKQEHFVHVINNKTIKNAANSCMLRLFMSLKMPTYFNLNQFFEIYQKQFIENCNFDNFSSFIEILLVVTNEVQAENFQPFFEGIESFPEMTKDFIGKFNEKAQDFLKDKSTSWNLLYNVSTEENKEEEEYKKVTNTLLLLSEFVVNCSKLASATTDYFFNCFQEIFSTTIYDPYLHLHLCSNLLKLPLSNEQKAEITSSLGCVFNRVFQTLLVPVKERDLILDFLLNLLVIDNSDSMKELFQSISNYSLTPSMKLSLLNIMNKSYRSGNSIFDYLWESGVNSPFFIQDEYPAIRLKSIDTIISILKLEDIIVDFDEMSTQQIDKNNFFEIFIYPNIKEMLGTTEWKEDKQTVFTALKTLISIVAEIPDLSEKVLFIVLNILSDHDYSVFPNQCINLLFSGLSSQAHFSILLRQFIPIIAFHIDELEDHFIKYPIKLFFFDKESISEKESKRLFCEIAAPYVIPYAYSNEKDQLINFFTEKLNKQKDEIFNEYSSYICSYFLNEIASSSSSNKNYFKENTFKSPMPLLSFVSKATDEAISSSYEKVLKDKKYTDEFIDIRQFVFIIYSNIYKAKHENVRLYHLHQFILYVSLVFKYHQNILNTKKTLYSDILGLTVNLLDFVYNEQISDLLNLISLNIPDKFQSDTIGFVKNIEDICSVLGNHSCLAHFFERFPSLIDAILIFDFLKEKQLESRTFKKEFERIARTKRVNQESIDFLLLNFVNNSKDIKLLDNLPNEMKRVALNEIYKYAISNPQTLALNLYSEMFLTFIQHYPSPLITESRINIPIFLFRKLLELVRDKNPSISRSALTSLHIINSKKVLPAIVQKDKDLMNQIGQYSNFAHIRKKIKKPADDSPWICKFINKYINQMSEKKMCWAFQSLAAESPEFCKMLFPIFFVECFASNLYDQIINDFKFYASNPRKYFDECKLFIKSFNYLRVYSYYYRNIKIPKWHLNWFGKEIDFVLLMETCLEIGDPFSAYQYAEFAHEAIDMNEEPLNRIFTHIGLNDLKYGLNINLSDTLSVASLHLQEGRFDKALVLYDNGNNVEKMSKTLCSLHLYNLLDNMNTLEKNVESLWRLRNWDVSSEIMRKMDYKDHSVSLFSVMQSFASNNEEATTEALKNFAENFRFDLISSVFTQLSYLLDASSLNWFQAVTFPNHSKLFEFFGDSTIDFYCHSLDRMKHLSRQHYNITESANALNGIFFCFLNELKNPSELFRAIPPKFFSDVITNALENDEIESAQYFIKLLRESQKKTPQFANFEQIRVFYESNNYHAVSLLDRNYKQIFLKESDLDSKERRNAFNLKVEFIHALWCAQTDSLPYAQISEQLHEVIKKSNSLKLIDLMAEAEFALAKVYQRRHREICDFYSSTNYDTFIDVIKYERGCIPKKNKDNVDEWKRYQETIERYKEMFSTTIVLAIKNYMNTLLHSNKYDLECTYAIVGLWFNYSYTKYKEYVEEVPDLIETLKEIFPKIQENKFLHLFYQLAARIDVVDAIDPTQTNNYNIDFQEFLREMLSSICKRNPNECFPILFALINTNQGNNKSQEIINLIDFITRESQELQRHWAEMKFLMRQYILIASEVTTDSKSLSQLDENIFKCTTDKKHYITIITSSKNVGINKFEDEITVFQSQTTPILIKIKGNDGKTYHQILKGKKDDLRQDAVMQQLFNLSSKLFSKKNPDLSMRHYKVIPLSKTIGVIEFVDGSISIGDYLFKVDDKRPLGAHFRYYLDVNKDKENSPILNASKCFNHCSDVYYEKRTDENKKTLINCFTQIRKSLKPVFHFFFIEQFPNPGDWFVSRLRYCQHTATNSIVGHILGIGDRHLNNIMIDKKTGEVIHIDLGIAFDQGKSLLVMENVPFRLTAEIIDGMGWLGKDGIFRKTCEESMSVLRKNSEYFLTVLEVFTSDPLYSWILVPKDERERFNDNRSGVPTEENRNKIAESVIVTCRRKLEGRETGEYLSVQGQVSKLINDASSDENLALMYKGWRPIL